MSKKLWGGRFTKKVDKEFFEFQKSIQFDHKLARYDVMHSMLHVLALAEAKLLKKPEKSKLYKALKAIREDVKKGRFKYDKRSEDIHTDIQNKVEKKVGKLALKLHTLRSRNDQVAFDEKAFCYKKSGEIIDLLDNLIASLVFLKKKYMHYSIVGYTHTQRAQTVLFKDYISAYSAMFGRDKKRLSNYYGNLEVHIGAGALAGSSIGRKNYDKAIAKLLSLIGDFYIRPSINTLDDVSDRDFIIELLSVISIIQMHLSRLAEDLILYSTKEFNFIKLPEEFCTGSSLMPHKKNPDFLELVRGNTGRIYGNLVSILVMMKGLPLTYNRDMQLDKEPLFSTVEAIEDEVKIMTRFLKGLELNKKNIYEALKDENLYAVKKADNLVRKSGMSFKEAHDFVGKEIKDRESLEERIAKLPTRNEKK
ncbi:MAG: argininosuccinate lyase [Candidatus Omnitrophica bacterium]|nr:argininosuccinate lyase [Candidatus Omnitrophota bacterium]